MKRWCDISFKKRIVWRIRFLRIVMLALLVFMVVVGETGGGDSRMQTRLAETMSRVLYFGGLIYIGVRIYQNKKLLKNRLLLKEKALWEYDEGRRALHLHSGGLVMDIMLIALYLAAMVASLYNMSAFYMAYGLLIVAVLLKAGSYLMHKTGCVRI